MQKVSVDLRRCDNSPRCPAMRSCPNGAIVPVIGGYSVNEDTCSGCLACVRVCPMGAVQPA